MSWSSWLVGGLAATAALTALLIGSQRLGLTRMDLPFLLGTMVTPRRGRARPLGVALHVVVGCLVALMYVAAFERWGGPSWWKGAALGLVHAAVVLAVVLPALPRLHPRMASEERGPTVTRQLEPPGVLGLHYGPLTPLALALGHLAFGVVLGALYRAW
jgi:hypothetical protein